MENRACPADFHLRPRAPTLRPGVTGGVASKRRDRRGLRGHVARHVDGRSDRRGRSDRVLSSDAHGDTTGRAAHRPGPPGESVRATGGLRIVRTAQRRVACESRGSTRSRTRSGSRLLTLAQGQHPTPNRKSAAAGLRFISPDRIGAAAAGTLRVAADA